MSSNNNHPLGEAHWFHVIVSTGFRTGFWPWEPEILAGLCARLIWVGFYYILHPTSLIIAAENGRYPPTQNGDIRSLFMLFALMAMQN